ncbi:hypothetical protein RHGRI_006649 [Rhododendron griersonianum]|uniref:RNase H type-1 domain-containing protein n=1 Tax=Rhododendron griersonianum TaxID=479676 RepID=A0AAV6KTU9_9ERIC|nr:hypothetical protein RHGRI_006649 [Rhododendron griersonianum]
MVVVGAITVIVVGIGAISVIIVGGGAISVIVVVGAITVIVVGGVGAITVVGGGAGCAVIVVSSGARTLLVLSGGAVVIGVLAIIDEDLVGFVDELETAGGAIPDGLGGVGVSIGVANNGLVVKTPMNPMTGIQKSWKDVLVSPALAYWKAPERKLLAVSPEVPAYWEAPERKLLAVSPEVPAYWKAPERKLLAVLPEVPAHREAPERKLLAVLPRAQTNNSTSLLQKAESLKGVAEDLLKAAKQYMAVRATRCSWDFLGKAKDAKEAIAVVVTLAKARTTQSTLGLLITQAEHSIMIAEKAQKRASVENYSIIRNIGKEMISQTRNPANSLAQPKVVDWSAQRRTNNSTALHKSSMLSRRLTSPIVRYATAIIKILETQAFSSMPVGIRPETPIKASKRQRQRRNKTLKKGEQKSVAANVMGAIEKALGSYNDDLEYPTESSESELNSSDGERGSVSTTTEEQFAKLVEQAKRTATSMPMPGTVTRSMAKQEQPKGLTVSEGDDSVSVYSSSPASSKSSSSMSKKPRSVTKAVSVMVTEVGDEESSNPRLLEEKVASLQEQLAKRDQEMSHLMEQIKKLIETKQRDNEPVTDFIAKWRALTFACPQKFTQLELIRMCLNNFRHELSTALMAQTFEGFNDLCTKAHDMELHLGKRRRPRVVDRLETSVAAIVETKKRVPVVVGGQRPKETKKATMKERLEKKYSFTDDLVEDMFEDLLEQKLITLPDVKRPHEEGKKNDPKYCPYHRLISHPLRDCFVLKDKIQELFDSRVIELPSPEKVIANPITADDDGEGEWFVYQSKGMKKRRSSSSRAKAPFVSKKVRKPKTSKKVKRTKVSKSARNKKKSQKKAKEVKLVPDEPLKQSPRITITLEEFLPEKLQSPELKAYFKKKRDEAVTQVPCLNIIVISDDEEEEESSASSPIHIPDSPIVISDDEEEGSNASCPIHISDFPTSRNLAVGEFMVTPKARVTPEKAMASPKYSHVPPMSYINTPEYVVSPSQRNMGYESDTELVRNSRKRLHFEDEKFSLKCQSDDEMWKHSTQSPHILESFVDSDFSPRYPSPARTYDGESVSSDHFDFSCNVISVDVNFQDADIQIRSCPEDDEKARVFARREGTNQAKERHPQGGEVITDDENSSVGSVNMVQINDEPKEGDGKEVVHVCKTYLTYKRQPRNQSSQNLQVPVTQDEVPKEEEQVKYDVLAHLKKIPALLSIYDALMMSPELRKSLVYALSNPDDFCKEIQEKGQKSTTTCLSTVVFGDEDMYAETLDHNRPLFITGLVLNTKISRVLVDAYYADARFYTKTSQNRVKGSTETNTKSVKAQTKKAFRYVPKSQRKLGASALAPIDPTLELKDAFVLPLQKAECTYVEDYCKFVVPAKAKGMKPIVFHALGDMEKKVQDDNLKTVEISSPIRPSYAANITKMLVKAGLDPEKVSTQTVAPFDSVLTHAQAKSLQQGSPIVVTREGLGYQAVEEKISVMQVEVQKAWEMYFDGATRSPNGQKQENLKNNKSGIGVVFVTPNNAIIPHSFALTEGCSNNEAEYEAVIARLELALQIPIEELLVYGDSELVIKQLRGEYIVKKASLAPYHEKASQLLSQFRKVNIFHVKRRINAQADSLASLAASLSLPDRETIIVTVGERRVLQPLTEISEVLPVFVATTKEGDKSKDTPGPQEFKL